jgi:hypothetical protein
VEDGPDPNTSVGKEARHALDVGAASIAQRALRVRFLGNGITVLDKVKLHTIRPPARQ